MSGKRKHRALNPSTARAPQDWYLYTKGKRYSLDGVEYRGEYHLVGSEAYTEPKPSETARPLRRLYPTIDEYIYDSLFDFDVKVDGFKEPQPSIVEPNQQDYRAGFFTRAFVEKINDPRSFALEIDTDLYRALSMGGGIDGGLYQSALVEWKLTGSIDSIEYHNRRELSKAVYKVPSILHAIKSLSEFATVTREVDYTVPTLDRPPKYADILRTIRRMYL